MAFDALVTRAISIELNSSLSGARIDKVFQIDSSTLILHVRNQGKNSKLLISADNNMPRIYLTHESFENPESATSLCMLLRKHLQGGFIERVSQYQYERIIEIDITSSTELQEHISLRLIVEIMGKHSNISLIRAEDNKLLDCIKHVSFDTSRVRQLLPGIVYEYPPRQDKMNLEDAATNYASTYREANEIDEDLFNHRVTGLSHIALEYVCNKASSAVIESRIQSLLNMACNGKISPFILFNENEPIDFYITKLGLTQDQSVQDFDSLSEAMDKFYGTKLLAQNLRRILDPLSRAVARAEEKAGSKQNKLHEDLQTNLNSDYYREYAEILSANLHLVPRGARSVKLNNFYTGEEIEIPLDEKLSPAKNVDRYFKKFSKAKKSIKEIQTQLNQNEQYIDYLNSVAQSIDTCASLEDADSIRNELIAAGLIHGQVKKIKKNQSKSANFLRYEISKDAYCLVGKNNTENDILTFEVASKQDLWFHVKDFAGSHLILRAKEASHQFTDEEIREAAIIAATHSKAKDSENVPVDYVPIRFVKKPASARPGYVIFTNNKTLFVKPK